MSKVSSEEDPFSVLEKVFAYLPLEHSEVLEDQRTSVSLFEALANQVLHLFIIDFFKMTMNVVYSM